MTAYPLGTRVRKTKGSSWQGHVVGHYSTTLTTDGVCVESEREPGSVQLYPVAALEAVPDVDVEVERLRLKVMHAQQKRVEWYAANPRPTTLIQRSLLHVGGGDHSRDPSTLGAGERPVSADQGQPPFVT